MTMLNGIVWLWERIARGMEAFYWRYRAPFYTVFFGLGIAALAEGIIWG